MLYSPFQSLFKVDVNSGLCREKKKKAHEFMAPFWGKGQQGGKFLSFSHQLWLKMRPYNTGETKNFQTMPKRLWKQRAQGCISMLITCRLYKHSLTVSDLKGHDEKIKTQNRWELRELKYVKSITLKGLSCNK